MAGSDETTKAVTDLDIAKKAVYEFTRSFLLAGKGAFNNLEGNGENKYVDAFGNIIGSAVGFVVPGSSNLVAEGVKKSLEYGNKKIKQSRKETFKFILDSHSKYSEDEFRRLFIERSVSVFLAYETSLKKVNYKVGKGENAMANKRQALQKLGKYAGAICLETIIKSESAELEKILETLRTPSKLGCILSLWRKVKKAKFYFFVNTTEYNANEAPVPAQAKELTKKHVTAANVFFNELDKFPQLYGGEEEASQEDFWRLNIEESKLVELVSAAISTDRVFFQASILLAPILDVKVNLKDIQEQLYCLLNKETADPKLISLVDHENDLNWELNEIAISVKLLSKDVKEFGLLEDIFSQMALLKAKEKTLESLKDKLEFIRQKTVELRNNHSNWDVYHTQNMYISNNKDLEKLCAEIKQNMASLNTFLRLNFSDKFSKKEDTLEKLYSNLESCAIQNVTDVCSLEAMQKASNCILDELKKIGFELPEIIDALLALQKIQLYSDITTSSFERSLAAAGQIAQKNQNDMEQLSKLVKESQSLRQIVAEEVEELEQNFQQATKNPTSLENASILKCLEENVVEQNQNMNKLNGLAEDILRLAPSFKITSHDFGDRLQKLLSMTTTQVNVNNNQTHLQEQETELIQDLEKNASKIEVLSRAVEEFKGRAGPLRNDFSQLPILNKIETTLESLKGELKEISQRIINLTKNHSNWDTFRTQNMVNSNNDFLDTLTKEIKHSPTEVLRLSFSINYAAQTEALQKLHQNLKSCAVTKVTDTSSLGDIRKVNQNTIHELTKIRSEFPEIQKKLLALQKIELCLDTTTASFEHSLARAEHTSQTNQKDIEQLIKMVDESQSLHKTISSAIKETVITTEQEIMDTHITDSKHLLALERLRAKVEYQSYDMHKLTELNKEIVMLAPSFQIASNELEDRLKNMHNKIFSQIERYNETPVETRFISKAYRRETDVPDVLPKKMKWSNQVHGFPPRSGHAAVAVGNQIYSFGGWNTSGHPTYIEDGPLDVFGLNDVNEQEMEWKIVLIKKTMWPFSSFAPSQRHFHSAVAYKEFVIIFGGAEAESFERSNTTFRFNTRTLKWNEPVVSGFIPDARCLHSAVVIGNQMLVFGGYSSEIKLLNDLYSLDVDTFHWSIIAAKDTAPSLRWRHSATVHKDRFMFIFGGRDHEKKDWLNDLFCFDVITKEWTRPETSGTTPQGRSGHSALTHKGLIFVFGGDNNQNSFLNDLFCYNPQTCEWKEVKPTGQPPSPRINFGCVALSDRVFVFGGWDGKRSDETFVLELAAQTRVSRKQHVTATDIFRNKFPALHVQGEKASQNKDYWCLHNLDELQIILLLFAAISKDQRFLTKIDIHMNNKEKEAVDPIVKDTLTPVETQSITRVHGKEIDVPNVFSNKMRWSNQVHGFPPRSNHAVVAVRNRIYSFRGLNDSGHPTFSRDGPLDAFVLNVNEREMKWKLLSVENKELNPSQRHFYSAVAHKEFVIIFGGKEGQSLAISNTTFRFNTEALKWDAPEVTGIIPDARALHSAVVIRNQMLVFGGENNKIKLSYDLHSLDLDKFHWSTIAAKGSAPSFRERHSATVHNDRFMFIFGGWGWDPNTKTSLNDLFCFDVVTKEWTRPETSGTTPQSRAGHSAFTHNGLIFVFGGYNNQGAFLNDLYCYNPQTRDWKEVRPAGQPPSPRSNFGCVALNDRVFVFGGWDGKYSDETFVLESE